jgi:hypothetical protein
MPQSNTSITRSSHLTLIFLSIFILAFFPGLLQFLVKLPLYPFKLLALPSAPSAPPPAPSPSYPPGCLLFQPDFTMSTSSSWFQKTLTLPAKSRGSYLITDTIISQLPEIVSYTVHSKHVSVLPGGSFNLNHDGVALQSSENLQRERDIFLIMINFLRLLLIRANAPVQRHANKNRKSTKLGCSISSCSTPPAHCQ